MIFFNFRFVLQMPIARVRSVAVSAPIANIQDIATWLNVPPAGLKEFGEEVRPVKVHSCHKQSNTWCLCYSQ